jgi:hypothetical protein
MIATPPTLGPPEASEEAYKDPLIGKWLRALQRRRSHYRAKNVDSACNRVDRPHDERCIKPCREQ